MSNRLINDGALHLIGVCGGDWYDGGFTEEDVRAALSEMSGDLDIRLNSPGGNAFQGIGIHNAILDYEGQVTVYVEALAASAASLLAMAADVVIMRPGSMMMIHDPSTLTYGDAKEHEKTSEFLNKLAASGASIYVAKSQKSIDEVRQIMREETWYSATEAVSEGFADQEDQSKVDEEAQMSAPQFDYSLFKNSPDKFRGLIPQNCGQQTAAFSAAITKEFALMSNKNKVVEGNSTSPAKTPAAAVMAADNGVPHTQSDPSLASEIAQAPSAIITDSLGAPLEPEMNARQIMLAIGEQCRNANLSAEITNKIMIEATTLEAAKTMMINALATPQDAPRQSASIGRDSAQSMHEGVTAALVTQFSGAAPSDQAREYMSQSIAELAARVSGQDGASLRSFAGREQVLMSAFAPHSTGDFPAIFSNALNKALLDRYMMAQPTYRRIARQRNFRDFRPHPQIRAGDFPKLQALTEAGEIKHGTFGEEQEIAMVEAYAVQFAVTRQMMVNDEMGAIQEVINSSGDEVANFEERRFYEFKAAATLVGGKPVYHADHGNVAGSGSAITVASLGAARAAMRKQKSVDKKSINITPRILLVSPDKETEAEQLITTITANDSAKVNPFEGRLEIVSPAEITGSAWELYADPSRAANFIWGYLDGYEAPRLTFDEPFGSQGLKAKLEHDFGVGAVDYRAGYKNPGN